MFLIVSFLSVPYFSFYAFIRSKIRIFASMIFAACLLVMITPTIIIPNVNPRQKLPTGLSAWSIFLVFFREKAYLSSDENNRTQSEQCPVFQRWEILCPRNHLCLILYTRLKIISYKSLFMFILVPCSFRSSRRISFH